MANILVAATPAPGHVNPMLSVARHLSSLGHSIIFLSGKLFHDQAVALGFRFVPFEGRADFDYRRMDEEFPEVAAAAPGPDAMNAVCMATGIDPVPDQYRTVRQILSKGGVDLIVTDIYFWGIFPLLLGPRDARPPVLTFGVLPLLVSSRDVAPFSGPDASPAGRLRNHEETQQFFAMMQPATTRMTEALHSSGTRELPEFFIDAAANLPDRFLQLTAEAFEYPRSDLKKSIEYIGNLMPGGHGKTSAPEWLNSLDASKPLVLVTQGTIANWDLSQLIEPAIAALADEPVTVVIAAGRPDLEVIQLPGGVKPENVRIEHYIPFEQILPRVDVFVTNGGFGSVNLSLSKGIPMVVAGDTEDKIFTASRVGWSEAGINLATGRPSVEQIRSAVRTVLSDKKYKENAVRLQKEFARYNAFDLITKTVNSMLSSKNFEQLLETAAARS
ncbi:MGT family glycosyltransferase [Silvibacterium bohemicum]|uniref:MGT family glycosyltransferase n=1 Tax=Silvibacterium bohemicum TaxID=1577686 RepID=A0A841JRL2_9BACT|nr:glycosyltransferase [Silvibacterium bohemicum]MBB6144032.1 MGT family glycosyltransferase [Silvibacterium bohemicum]